MPQQEKPKAKPAQPGTPAAGGPTRARIDLTGEGKPEWTREIDTQAPPRVDAETRSLGDAFAGEEGSDLDQTLRMLEERKKPYSPPVVTDADRQRAAAESLRLHGYGPAEPRAVEVPGALGSTEFTVGRSTVGYGVDADPRAVANRLKQAAGDIIDFENAQ